MSLLRALIHSQAAITTKKPAIPVSQTTGTPAKKLAGDTAQIAVRQPIPITNQAAPDPEAVQGALDSAQEMGRQFRLSEARRLRQFLQQKI